MNDLREKLAAYSHGAWAQWMKYMFTRGSWVMKPYRPEKQEPGSAEWLMPAHNADRWRRQMNTPYVDLPEPEKASDLTEADKILAVIQPYITEKDARIQELTALVYDLVAQACRDGDRFDSDGMSTYEQAIMLLVNAGLLRLVPAGRIIAVPVEPHD